MARWFKESGVTSVAMESTGVYWIPAYEVLEEYGFHVILVNARYAKNVPGRKTDVSDAAWLQRLHSYELLRGSFRPEAGVATMRAYLRQRERLIEYTASHIQHMQKALMEMNVQLHHVVSDITGVTGMRIIRAIVAGERTPITLAEMRDVRCHASVGTICAALSGNWRDEHIFALCQSLALYDLYQIKILECDRKLEVALKALEIDKGHDIRGLPKVRIKRRQVNTPDFEVRSALYRVLGVDLTQIHGIGPSLALKLVGECGTDLAAWPSSKHFTSWLCLARVTKYRAANCCRRKPGDHRAARRRSCGWPQPPSVAVTPHWARFTGGYRRARERRRRSRPPHARSPSCFTTACATAWRITIPAPPNMKSGIATG